MSLVWAVPALRWDVYQLAENNDRGRDIEERNFGADPGKRALSHFLHCLCKSWHRYLQTSAVELRVAFIRISNNLTSSDMQVFGRSSNFVDPVPIQ